MNESDTRALQKLLELDSQTQVLQQARVQGLLDIWEVTDIDGGSIYARPVHEPETMPRAVIAIAGLRAGLGDEIMIAKVGGQPFAIGATRTSSPGYSMLQATPIIVPTHLRTGDAGWTSTTDFASLRVTVHDLDPGISYLVSATAGAYLTSASASTKVGMGVRIGFASDPNSTGTPEWGAGHQNITPTWATATFHRVVSSVASIQVTARGYSTASGAHTIGDGQVDITITPLHTAGRE